MKSCPFLPAPFGFLLDTSSVSSISSKKGNASCKETSLQNQYNSAEQHFEADTASDYHQALKISKEVSSKINELALLADQRKSERFDKIAGGIAGFFAGYLVGSFPGCFVASVTGSENAGGITVIVCGIIGAIIGWCYKLSKHNKQRGKETRQMQIANCKLQNLVLTFAF